MLILISPAKTLDFENSLEIGATTRPLFLAEAAKINRSLKRLSKKKLAELQSISTSLAELNYRRNQEWNEDHKEGVKQAALAFQGDVYQGMQAENWGEQQMSFAADHLLILSGLYGILRPTDLILPYRLEMGTSIKVGRREDLYQFWQDKLKQYFRKEVKAEVPIINLASQEYFRAVKTAGVKNPVVDIHFRDYHQGEYKVLSFFAKQARGSMADFIIREELQEPAALKDFNRDGYYFDEASSTATDYVFLRERKN